MNWKAKARLHRLIDALPAGRELNYILQRYISGSLPAPDAEVAYKCKIAWGIYLSMKRYFGAGWTEECVAGDIGAGWDLTVPLSLYRFGIGRQVCMDVYPNLRSGLLKSTIASLKRVEAEMAGCGVEFKHPLHSISGKDMEAELLKKYNIEYKAPVDSAHTGLPDASFDVLYSVHVFQYLQRQQIIDILKECRRLMKEKSLLCLKVNLQEDFMKPDGTQNPYRFLEYSDEEWERLSVPGRMQNRLRYKDYMQLFKQEGFAVLEAHPQLPDEKDMQWIQKLKPHPFFQEHYKPEELAVKDFRVCLVKS